MQTQDVRRHSFSSALCPSSLDQDHVKYVWVLILRYILFRRFQDNRQIMYEKASRGLEEQFQQVMSRIAIKYLL